MHGANMKTHFMLYNFFSQNRAIDEIMWKHILERGRSQMTIWRMNIACCIPRATNIHTDRVILIAFPQQQRLHERAPVLRYTYVAFLNCI